jgi:hypothetical protein
MLNKNNERTIPQVSDLVTVLRLEQPSATRSRKDTIRVRGPGINSPWSRQLNYVEDLGAAD